MAWKRVYVPGKGWRYTDGKGNYKTNNPTRSQYRNVANDVVDAGANATKKGAQRVGNTAKESVRASGEAANRTIKNEESAKNQAIGYKARKDREKEQAQVKPQSLNQRDRRVGNTEVGSLRQAQNNAIKAYEKNKQSQAKPQASSKQDSSGQPRTYASGSTRTTTASVTETKPIPKPAGKVPASDAGMKNQNKDFRGNPNRKDSIASTLSELRSMGSGRKVEGVGPVASGSDYAKSKNETLKERMERMKKRRQGTSIGGVD